jgi:hypothetical protein
VGSWLVRWLGLGVGLIGSIISANIYIYTHHLLLRLVN